MPQNQGIFLLYNKTLWIAVDYHVKSLIFNNLSNKNTISIIERTKDKFVPIRKCLIFGPNFQWAFLYFYKLAIPGLFLFIFGLFQTIFSTNKWEKLSIQYMVLGFEPIAFTDPITTRPGIPPVRICIFILHSYQICDNWTSPNLFSLRVSSYNNLLRQMHSFIYFWYHTLSNLCIFLSALSCPILDIAITVFWTCVCDQVGFHRLRYERGRGTNLWQDAFGILALLSCRNGISSSIDL